MLTLSHRWPRPTAAWGSVVTARVQGLAQAKGRTQGHCHGLRLAKPVLKSREHVNTMLRDRHVCHEQAVDWQEHPAEYILAHNLKGQVRFLGKHVGDC